MVEVLNQQNSYRVSLKTVRGLLEALLVKYRPDGPDITLALVDTSTIKALNRRFLNRPGATDVLSFPGGDPGPDGRRHLGDIVICVPQAFRQCRREAHGLETEVLDLAVHGFLHLVGFDHGQGIETEEVRARRELVAG
jgi:probable rRNA maturation factor